MIFKNMSAAEINAVASAIAEKPLGRVATREKAEARLIRLAKERFGDFADGIIADFHTADRKDICLAIVEREIAEIEGPKAPAAPKEAKAKAAPTPVDVDAILAGLTDGSLRMSDKRLAAVSEAGIVPPAPDFSAETHKRFRPLLAEVVAAVDAGDVEAIEAITINTISSSPKAIARYRDAAIIALKRQAGA